MQISTERRKDMRADHLLVALVLAAACLGAGAASADGLRCNGRILTVGDPKARLLSHCGEPSAREVVAVVRGYEDGAERRANRSEVWTYETDAVDGYRLLRFEGGRLVGEGMRCDGRLVSPGDTTLTVLSLCGEPVTLDAAGFEQTAPVPASIAITSESLVEQWVYDRGPGTLLKIVELRGGRIERIEDGPRQ